MFNKRQMKPKALRFLYEVVRVHYSTYNTVSPLKQIVIKDKLIR